MKKIMVVLQLLKQSSKNNKIKKYESTQKGCFFYLKKKWKTILRCMFILESSYE